MALTIELGQQSVELVGQLVTVRVPIIIRDELGEIVREETGEHTVNRFNPAAQAYLEEGIKLDANAALAAAKAQAAAEVEFAGVRAGVEADLEA